MIKLFKESPNTTSELLEESEIPKNQTQLFIWLVMKRVNCSDPDHCAQPSALRAKRGELHLLETAFCNWYQYQEKLVGRIESVSQDQQHSVDFWNIDISEEQEWFKHEILQDRGYRKWFLEQLTQSIKSDIPYPSQYERYLLDGSLFI